MTNTELFNHYEGRLLAAGRRYTYQFEDSKKEGLRVAWSKLRGFIAESGSEAMRDRLREVERVAYSDGYWMEG